MRKLLIIVLVGAPLWATNYYVNNTCTNNGTGLSASCAASPGALGAYNSIANIGAGAYAAGNTIDGASLTYRETMTVGGSGSAGSPLIIQHFVIKGSNVMSGWSSYGSGAGSTWQVAYAHTLSSGTGYVFKNGTKLTWGASATTLTDQQYFWASNVLYFRNDAGNPDTLGLLMEATNRSTPLSIPSRNYVTVQNVTVSQAEANAIRYSTLSDHAAMNNVTVTQSYVPLQLSAATNATVSNLDVENMYFSGIAIDTSSLSSITINNLKCVGIAGNCINDTNSNASTVVTINNCSVDSYASSPFLLTGGSTLNLSDCMSTGTSYGTADYPIKGTAGTIAEDYLLALPDGQDGSKEPVYTSHVTEGAHNTYISPAWTKSSKVGVVGIITDDYTSECDWVKLNDFAEGFGIHTSFSLSLTYLFNSTAATLYGTTATGLSGTNCLGSPYVASIIPQHGSTDHAIIQDEINRGHDVLSHTRSHPSLSTLTSGACASTLCAFDIHYTGTGSAATLTITGCAGSGPCTLTTSVTGAADNLSYDLTSATYIQIAYVCTAIQATGKYTCTQTVGSHENYSYRVPSIMLAPLSAQDIKTATYSPLWSATPFYANELADSMADINAAFTCTSAPRVGECSTGTFVVPALNYPDGNYDSNVISSLISDGYTNARADVSTPGWITPFNMYELTSGTNSNNAVGYVIPFNNACTDGSISGNNFTCSNVTYSTTQFYRTAYSGLFNGTSSYAYKVAGAQYSDFHRGDFVLAYQLYPTALSGNSTLYFQRTDDTHYIWLYVDSSGAIHFLIDGTTLLQSANGAITTGSGSGATGTWQEVEVNARNGLYRLFVNYALVQSTFSTIRPETYTGNVQLGASNFGGTNGNFYTGYMSDALAGFEPYMRTMAQMGTLAANGGVTFYGSHGEAGFPRSVARSIFEAMNDFVNKGGHVVVTTQSQAAAYMLAAGSLQSDNQTLIWTQTPSGDYHPRLGSPACGKGTTPGIATDFDGYAWITMDVGPYRCKPTAVFSGVI